MQFPSFSAAAARRLFGTGAMANLVRINSIRYNSRQRMQPELASPHELMELLIVVRFNYKICPAGGSVCLSGSNLVHTILVCACLSVFQGTRLVHMILVCACLSVFQGTRLVHTILVCTCLSVCQGTRLVHMILVCACLSVCQGAT